MRTYTIRRHNNDPHMAEVVDKKGNICFIGMDYEAFDWVQDKYTNWTGICEIAATKDSETRYQVTGPDVHWTESFDNLCNAIEYACNNVEMTGDTFFVNDTWTGRSARF